MYRTPQRTKRRHRRRRLRLADPSSALGGLVWSVGPGLEAVDHRMCMRWRTYDVDCSSSATSVTRPTARDYPRDFAVRVAETGGRCYFNWCLVVCFIDGRKFSVPSCVQYSTCERYRTAILSSCVPAPQSSFIVAKAANTVHTDTQMQYPIYTVIDKTHGSLYLTVILDNLNHLKIHLYRLSADRMLHAFIVNCLHHLKHVRTQLRKIQNKLHFGLSP